MNKKNLPHCGYLGISLNVYVCVAHVFYVLLLDIQKSQQEEVYSRVWLSLLLWPTCAHVTGNAFENCAEKKSANRKTDKSWEKLLYSGGRQINNWEYWVVLGGLSLGTRFFFSISTSSIITFFLPRTGVGFIAFEEGHVIQTNIFHLYPNWIT